MKEQFEPRSEIKVNSVWDSSLVKTRKKLWNYLRKKDRGTLPNEEGKIVRTKGGLYKFGPYTDTLENLKEFAKIRGLNSLKMGCVNVKVC